MKKIGRDEHYVLDLCDRVLGAKASRQHRFEWLRGDPVDEEGKATGRKLPVDAYYADQRLVVEYRERQHSEPVAIMDRRATVSGCPRGMQRKIYDQRRRTEIPKNGLRLVELDFSIFKHKKGSRKLLRDAWHDERIIDERIIMTRLSSS